MQSQPKNSYNHTTIPKKWGTPTCKHREQINERKMRIENTKTIKEEN